jgi:hypothetical protein
VSFPECLFETVLRSEAAQKTFASNNPRGPSASSRSTGNTSLLDEWTEHAPPWMPFQISLPRKWSRDSFHMVAREISAVADTER